jgi:ribosomal protein L34E
MENELEEKKEANLSKCSSCQEIKHRIQNGFFPDNRNKRWVDDKGENWIGRKCPECVRSMMKVRMAKLRSKE